ncbi:MAG: GGDEF domain-containing protein [Bacillota bacterium]
MLSENHLNMTFNKYLGEFKDSQTEAEFILHETDGVIRFIRSAALILGFLFFLFIIPDYYITESSQTFRFILYIRSAFLLLIIILYLVLRYWPEKVSLLRWISVYEFIVSIFFLLIYYLYESPNFFIHSLGAVALILAFFNVTNRWIYTVSVSLFLGLGFIITSALRPENIPASEFAAVGIYFALFIMISSISSYRINVYKRMQYINNIELKRLSETDTLTGIYIRRKFDQEVNKLMDLASRYNHPLSLVLFDIDNLKRINDEYGHLTGDRVLSTLAGIVKAALRSSDIFARWGGDEFAILLPHTTKSQARELAERIRDIIVSHYFTQVGYISCSFGVTAYQKGDDINSLISRVDRRLYKAKKTGRNIVM